MAELAIKETNDNVSNFIESIDNPVKKEDCKTLLKMMTEVSGEEPKMWGNMIGFGKYTYTRKGSKQEHEWFRLGFAPRAAKISVYLTVDISKYDTYLKELGKCKWGKGCLYINKLSDVNLDVLKSLIQKSKDTTWI